MSESQCPHLEYKANVAIGRIEGDTVKAVDITARCLNCDKPLVFICKAPIGVSWNTPALSMDGTELRVPAYVEGDVVDNRPRAEFSVQTL